MRGSGQHLLGLALAAVVLTGLLALPWWSGEETVTSKKVDDRLEALEKDQRRLSGQLQDTDARLIHLEEMRGEVHEAIAQVLPSEARWVPLRPGGSEQWSFPAGGRAQVQFLEMTESGAPLFSIKNRAAEAEMPLLAGQSMRAVDDQGDSKRVYTTTVHRLRFDRTGRPEAALVSVVVTVEVS
jgi:hypothetical protein